MKDYTVDYYYLNEFVGGAGILADNISQACYHAKQEALLDNQYGVKYDYMVVYDKYGNTVESWL